MSSTKSYLSTIGNNLLFVKQSVTSSLTALMNKGLGQITEENLNKVVNSIVTKLEKDTQRDLDQSLPKPQTASRRIGQISAIGLAYAPLSKAVEAFESCFNQKKPTTLKHKKNWSFLLNPWIHLARLYKNYPKIQLVN